MTSIEYDDIFVRFVLRVEDRFDMDRDRDLLIMWLHMGMADPYLHDVFSALECDDDIEEVTFEMALETAEAIDTEFVLELLVNEMIVKWLEPRVRSVKNVLQMFGGKEEKFFSQAQHINELRSMLEDARIDIKKRIAERGGIINSYLEET